MRIIAGRYRHRLLHANPGLTTRPITDRAKVRLFDHMHKLVVGRRTLDLFCGTGSLGLEALSRGAKSVVFMEQDRRAFDLLRENIRELKAENEVLCWRNDALRSSYKPRDERTLFPYDLIFFDPPYPMLARLSPGEPLYKSLLRLAKSDVSATDALLVLRAPEQAEFTMPPQWQPEFDVKVGSMLLLVYRLVECATAEADVEVAEDADDLDGPTLDHPDDEPMR